MSLLFGEIRQLGMVVRDADTAIAHWAALGVGPFFKTTLTMDDFRYRGYPGPGPTVTLCFAFSGPLQIELIQQHNDAPSAYLDFLAAGREGAQHVSSWFSRHEDYDRAYELMLTKGFNIAQEGASRQFDARFAYFESAAPGGLMIELAEALYPPGDSFVKAMQDAAKGWDGIKATREFGDA